MESVFNFTYWILVMLCLMIFGRYISAANWRTRINKYFIMSVKKYLRWIIFHPHPVSSLLSWMPWWRVRAPRSWSAAGRRCRRCRWRECRGSSTRVRRDNSAPAAPRPRPQPSSAWRGFYPSRSYSLSILYIVNHFISFKKVIYKFALLWGEAQSCLPQGNL